MKKDIEMASLHEKIYIPDLSFFDAINLIYGQDECEIRLIRCVENTCEYDNNYLSITFPNEQMELAEHYFYEIKSILS